MSHLHWISRDDPPEAFPPVERACLRPNGLLAAGGDLSPPRLLAAYRRGIFPWFEEGQPVLWWSPDPRMTLKPSAIHVSRSLKRHIQRGQFNLTLNCAFEQVMKACAGPRLGQRGTWITASMQHAYAQLHKRGQAHSLEVWRDDELIGGIYGVAHGKVFFGESMFSAESNASKVALTALARWLEFQEFALIDCQVRSAHLLTMGCVEIPRNTFIQHLDTHCEQSVPTETWQKYHSLPVKLL